jgi:hypothetical protein
MFTARRETRNPRGWGILRDDDGQPLVIRRYSDNLLLALLKARRPEKFKDRAVVEHDIADGLADRLEAARQRAIAQVQGTVTRLPTPLPSLVDKSGH